MPASYEGKKVANNISFAGKTFPGGQHLKTKLDILIGSVLYESLSLQETPASAVAPIEPDLGLLLGIKYFYIDGKITSSDTGVTANETFGLPIPVVGLRLQESLSDKVQAELNYTFMNIKTSNYHISWSDFYPELKLNFVKNLPFGVGYKLTKVNLEADAGSQGFLSRFGFNGLYLFGSLNF
jgi:hypothetical protein